MAHESIKFQGAHIWGRNGFDGDVEAWEASRSGYCVKKPDLKLNANNNRLAYAA